MAHVLPIRSKLHNRSVVLVVLVIHIQIALAQIALAQNTQKPAGSNPEQKKATSSAGEVKAAEPSPVLLQLNGALESLAAKVSPAVVQILVT